MRTTKKKKSFDANNRNNSLVDILRHLFFDSRGLCCTRILWTLFFLCFFLIGIHRIASYRVNNEVLVKLPINDIERECPKPNYTTVLQDEQRRSRSRSGATNPSAAASTPQICVTTLTDTVKADPIQKLLRWRDFGSLLDMTWPNKQRYCEKQNYKLFDESAYLDTSRPPSWSKIRAVRRLLLTENCDWVFWIDADTVFMNSNKRIEDFLPDTSSSINLLVTTEEQQQKQQGRQGQQTTSWNAGAWLIRNTPWSMKFLQHWWDMTEFVRPKGISVSGDNDALHAFLSSMKQDYFDQHIAVPPRCLFNSVATFMTKEEREQMTPDKVRIQPWYMSLERYHKGDLVAHAAAGVDNKITTSKILLEDAV